MVKLLRRKKRMNHGDTETRSKEGGE